MTSELQHLKQKIRRLEAGGEPNLALRREYNAKLQAHRDRAAHLLGGGRTLKWVQNKIALLKPLKERVDGLAQDVKTLDENGKGDRIKIESLERGSKALAEVVAGLQKMVVAISKPHTDSA